MGSLFAALSRILLLGQVRLLIEERAARFGRRVARAGAFLALGGIFILLAFGFAGLSASLLLARLLPLPWALLVVAGVCLVFGAGALVVGARVLKRNQPPSSAGDAAPLPSVAALAETGGRALGDFIHAHQTEALLAAVLVGVLANRPGKRQR